MKSSTRIPMTALIVGWGVWFGAPSGSLLAQGIPEPNLVLYGVVRNQAAASARMTVGNITWRWRSALGGNPITVSTVLTNLNDQFSYVQRVPCEYPVSGFAATPNTFQLLSSAIGYTLESVDVDGHAGVPSLTSLSLSTADRGSVVQVDVTVDYAPTDSDGDGLPDEWECRYFACNGHPLLDDDGDGMNNLAEYQAGTDPTDPQSLFAFIDIARQEDGTMALRWSSVEGKVYSILRSADPATGYVSVKTGVVAEPPTNTYHDPVPPDGSPRFYRLLLEP